MSNRLLVIRVGVRSGSALSIRDALARHVEVVDVDLQPLVRDVRLLPARLRAEVRAARQRGSHGFTKTAAWTKSVERFCSRHSPVSSWRGPVLFTSTLPAWASFDRPYTIYTDRVFAEGAAAPTEHRSTADPGWVDREREFVRRATFVASAGPSTTPYLTDQYGIPASRTSFVGSGPNSPLAPIASGGDRSYTASGSGIRLLFVGRQWELHGGPIAIAGTQAAIDAGLNCTLTVAGCNPGGVPSWVDVLGPVPREQAGRLFGTHDVYLRPSLQDAFPVAVQEALLCGTPVIGTRLGNQEWMIGEGGLVVAPGDALDLGRAILQVAGSIEEYRRAAQRQANSRRSFFDWDETAQRLLSHMDLR